MSRIFAAIGTNTDAIRRTKSNPLLKLILVIVHAVSASWLIVRVSRSFSSFFYLACSYDYLHFEGSISQCSYLGISIRFIPRHLFDILEIFWSVIYVRFAGNEVVFKHKDCILLNMINPFRFETTNDLLTMCVCVQSGIPRSTLFYSKWVDSRQC